MARAGQAQSMADYFGQLRSDYQVAKSSQYRRRRTGILPMGTTADWHVRVEVDFLHVIEIVRDMDRNDVIVGQMVDRAVTNTLQDGITPDPNTGDKGLNKALLENWEEWCESPDAVDIQGEQTFHDLEYQVLRSTLVDGDICCLPRKEGCLQLFEAHRLRRPMSTLLNVVGGILLDDNRKRLEYWFTKDDIPPYQALNLVRDMNKVPARDADGFRQVFHVRNPKRCTQTRGLSALIPCVDTAGMFEDIAFAKLVQAQVTSCFAIFRERELKFDLNDASLNTGELSTMTLPDGSTRVIRGIAPGMEFTGKPGEKLQGFSPAVPNAEFFEHAKLMLTLIGINLGLPLVLLLLDASETNFSGFRGAVDQARLGFRRNQRWLIERFHRPVWKWRVRMEMANDPAMRLAAQKSGVNIFRHNWNRPSWPYIEPLKDASTDLMRVRNALISPRRLQAERGRKWKDVCREVVEDNALAIMRAKKMAAFINSRYPDDQPVHWRELISLPTPDGVNLTLGPEGGTEAKESPAAPAAKKPAGANAANPGLPVNRLNGAAHG